MMFDCCLFIFCYNKIMTKLIIIRGPAGVGKTTIAKAVAKQLNGVHFNIDQVLRDAGLDKSEGDIPVDNFLQAQESIFPEVKKYLEQGEPVVFDGNFYYQEQIDQLTREFPDQVNIFTLQASLETCWERNKTKEEHQLDRISVEAMHRISSNLKVGKVIDTEGKSEEEVINEIISAIIKEEDK